MKQLSFALIVLFLAYSCKKDERVKDAPELPPVETMVINFGELANAEKSVSMVKTNWLYSAATVGIWNTIIGTTFAVPVAAFTSAFKYQATKIDDLVWQWEYTVDGFTSQYTARLVGILESNQVKWEMYITKTGINPFDEFLWFEGTSKLDGTNGQWILYHSAAFPEETVQIDWVRESGEVGQIKYTYVRELNDQRVADKFNGSTLTYGLKEGDFDIYVNVHAFDFQSQMFYDTYIEWNRTSYNGHVKAELFFNDTDWHCWNSLGDDVDCN